MLGVPQLDGNISRDSLSVSSFESCLSDLLSAESQNEVSWFSQESGHSNNSVRGYAIPVRVIPRSKQVTSNSRPQTLRPIVCDN